MGIDHDPPQTCQVSMRFSYTLDEETDQRRRTAGTSDAEEMASTVDVVNVHLETSAAFHALAAENVAGRVENVEVLLGVIAGLNAVEVVAAAVEAVAASVEEGGHPDSEIHLYSLFSTLISISSDHTWTA